MVQTIHVVTLEEVMRLAEQLSPVDKMRLIGRIAPEIERELAADHPAAGVSLLGLVQDLGPAPPVEEIDAARREVWGCFLGNDY